MVRKTNDSRRIRRDTVRHEEVEQTPQLHQVVLQRCSRQEQPSLGFESKERLPSLTPEILNVMRLIQDHVHPALPPKYVLIRKNDLIARDAHLPRVLGLPADSLLLSLLLVAVVGEDFETGEELLELHLPVEDYGRWDDDEMLAPNALVASEVTE